MEMVLLVATTVLVMIMMPMIMLGMMVTKKQILSMMSFVADKCGD